MWTGIGVGQLEMEWNDTAMNCDKKSYTDYQKQRGGWKTKQQFKYAGFFVIWNIENITEFGLKINME